MFKFSFISPAVMSCYVSYTPPTSSPTSVRQKRGSKIINPPKHANRCKPNNHHTHPTRVPKGIQHPSAACPSHTTNPLHPPKSQNPGPA
ncbi:hypothetical protein VTJ04DRAFT_5174 [Mycothermus thermophilus]|uniref:uncharacterized protein n=1 Tax=Humicola insolens TaxID=85995 RepID=UPI003743216D